MEHPPDDTPRTPASYADFSEEEEQGGWLKTSVQFFAIPMLIVVMAVGQVDLAFRQFRIVGFGHDGHDPVGDCVLALDDVVEHRALDVHRVELAFCTDLAREQLGEVSRAAADVGDDLSGRDGTSPSMLTWIWTS